MIINLSLSGIQALLLPDIFIYYIASFARIKDRNLVDIFVFEQCVRSKIFQKFFRKFSFLVEFFTAHIKSDNTFFFTSLNKLSGSQTTKYYLRYLPSFLSLSRFEMSRCCM